MIVSLSSKLRVGTDLAHALPQQRVIETPVRAGRATT
jgi:hypothetical protein